MITTLGWALLVVSTAGAAEFKTSALPPITGNTPTYAGEISAPPMPHWSRQLPGKPLSSATHSEHTRPVFVPLGILVGSAAGDALYLLDRRDGSLIRSYPALASVESEPLLDGEDVLFTDTGGGVWCYNVTTGENLWSYQTKAPSVARPTVAGGLVFVTTVDDLVVALRRDTGELVWRFQQQPDLTRRTELSLYASAPATVVDGKVLVGFSDGSLVALVAENGDLFWSVHVGEGKYPDIVAAPAVSPDGMIFASGYFDPLIAMKGARGVAWSLAFGAAASPVVHEGPGGYVLYHPGTDGNLRAIQSTTGEVLWTWLSGSDGALTEPQWTPMGILIGSTSGPLWLVNPDTGEEVWRYAPMRVVDGLSAAPAVSGRQVVFVSNSGLVYSLLTPAPDAQHPTIEWRLHRPDIDPSRVTPLPGPGANKPPRP